MTPRNPGPGTSPPTKFPPTIWSFGRIPSDSKAPHFDRQSCVYRSPKAETGYDLFKCRQIISTYSSSPGWSDIPRRLPLWCDLATDHHIPSGEIVPRFYATARYILRAEMTAFDLTGADGRPAGFEQPSPRPDVYTSAFFGPSLWLGKATATRGKHPTSTN